MKKKRVDVKIELMRPLRRPARYGTGRMEVPAGLGTVALLIGMRNVIHGLFDSQVSYITIAARKRTIHQTEIAAFQRCSSGVQGGCRTRNRGPSPTKLPDDSDAPQSREASRIFAAPWAS